ncbi:MAG: CgeB family protein, partial [Brachybacterium tyrofermentans]
MPPQSSSRLQTLRTGLWHLRTGGLAQVRTWNRRRRTVSYGVGDGLGSKDAKGHLSFPPAKLVERAPRLEGLRVAVILDDFSMLAWSHEFETLAVKPSTWREQLAEQRVDLLLVESAWHGNKDAWQYQLTGSKAPSEPLRELVAHCRDAGIPTVFWNKEDPPHFEDFLDTATLFDQVFTTDVTLLPRYREALGYDNVEVLPFAAQSAVHNPIRPKHGHQARDVAFAGMYFAHKFPERREQMDMLLGGALDVSSRMETGLEIFSRFLGDDERYQFPGDLADRVVGSLGYDRMLTAYKAYKVFLNVNSVVTSPSM